MNPENLRGITPSAGLEDFHFFGDQLAKVFVRGHHVDLVARRFRLVRQGSNDIVRFKSGNTQRGYAHGFEQLMNVGDCHFDALGGLVPVGFIRWEELLTHLAAADVKHDCHVARAFLFDHIE